MTNWQLIITLATLVFAIFGASWMSLQTLKSYIDARIDTIIAEIGSLRREIGHLSQRTDKIDRQLEAIFKPSLPRAGD